MTFLIWVSDHWMELLAWMGIGGGSGLAAKKMIDKRQDKRIVLLFENVRKLKDRDFTFEKELILLKNEIKNNSMMDKEFKSQTKREHTGIKDDMKEIKDNLKSILDHLLNKK